MVVRLCDDPHILRSSIQLSALFMDHLNLIDPIFLQKNIGLSLSHLVPEIFGPNVDPMFHQNVLFKIN